MAVYDLAVIGAGIAGLGVFESAGRAGLKAVLIDRGAPGGATTAVTSGLFHGGLRYLSYDVATSLLMCREIARVRRERPDLLRRQAFLWPVYRGDRLGLGLISALQQEYDLFAPLRGARRHARLTAEEAVSALPGLRREGLLGAVAFDEWRVDVAGLVGLLAAAGRAAGGEILEGWRATALSRSAGRVSAATVADGRGAQREIEARVFVNAAGPWAEEVARLAGVRSVRLRLRKGVHLVIPGDPPPHGLIFPGPGGRSLGVYPRESQTWVGPTDEPHDGSPDDVRASPAEIESLRLSLAAVLPDLARRDCRAVAGLRPIPSQRGAAFLLSREHRIFDHAGEGVENFLTLAGGKLTTYRPMGDSALAAVLGKLGRRAPAAPAPPREESGLPWSLMRPRGRAADLAASAGLLAFFAARQALCGSSRSGWASFAGDSR